jgi:hypothetical protein
MTLYGTGMRRAELARLKVSDHHFSYALLQALAPLSTISMHAFQFAFALPALHWAPNCHSNPIAQRVRRKRPRLPPGLLIENVSGLISRPAYNYLAEAFPIKPSDLSELALNVIKN